MYTCNLESMENKIKTFSKFGDAGHGGITRYSLSKEAIMARKEFQKRMENIGAVIEVDDLTNMRSEEHTSELSHTLASRMPSSA